ncbi:hypothetical protein XpopCFBP1817_13790 [Xanthomonas populi]|uniref:Uncharacterized protein n=1 Tax=Xanthomonas populi TaxID=53414 RepID=A0A2S7EMC1_9XANT|nr:hypothetical protein XpopCFBP1817_13790 [Xanthomonas populi]
MRAGCGPIAQWSNASESRRGALTARGTRRESVDGGSVAASMPPRVPQSVRTKQPASLLVALLQPCVSIREVAARSAARYAGCGSAGPDRSPARAHAPDKPG